jgi:P-type Ca2+ transporter type 2B
LARSQP